MTYSDHDRALVAAVERYGEAASLRVLANTFDLRPSRNSVHVWIREQRIEPTDDAGEEIAELDRLRKACWQASMHARRDDTFDAFEAACDARNYLGMQQAATAIGILYDKLVRPTQAGLGLSASGDAAAINLMVVAPASTDGSDHRPVIEGESRNLPPPDGAAVGG